MDLESKIVQGISKLLFERFGIRASYQDILSYRSSRLSSEIVDCIAHLRDYFEQLQDVVIMSDDQMTPGEINKKLVAYAEANGKTYHREVAHRDYRTGIETKFLEFDRYVPNNPNEYVIIITDHISELDTNGHRNIKEAIETHSDNMRILRNRFGYIPVDIQQQASSQENIDHFKLDKLEPSVEGLGESKLTQRKVNVILGLFSPAVHEIKSYRGYDITRLKDNYRNLSLIRNRNGASNINVGLYFDGATNYFEELPRSDDFKNTPALYEKYEKGLIGPLNLDKQRKFTF
jgi:hypothetical protein